MSLFCNTLQAIAEGYLIAAVVMMFCGLRGQILSCLGCMVIYWALLRYVPYDGHSGGLFEQGNNLAIYIDHCLQGDWQDGTPYSWILTSLSFGALTLLGAVSGRVIALYRGVCGGWRSCQPGEGCCWRQPVCWSRIRRLLSIFTRRPAYCGQVGAVCCCWLFFTC